MDAFVADATPTALPPGPRTPRLWQSIRFSLWPYATVAMGARRWGERYTTASFAGPGKMVVFTDPEAIKDIFTADGNERAHASLLRAQRARRPCITISE